MIISPETDVNTSCKNSQIFEDKTSHRCIKPCFTPSYCQQIWFPCCLTAKWCSKHWVPRGLWEKWHICCVHCGPLIVFLRYVFFFMIKSPFNYARNSHFVRMKCFRFIFRKRAREKLVVRWRCLLSIHFTHSQGQSFLVSSPAVWTHTHFIFFFLCFWQ